MEKIVPIRMEREKGTVPYFSFSAFTLLGP